MKLPIEHFDDGYLPKLPPGHQNLYDQERKTGRIRRVMEALVIDEEIPDTELGVIVVADLAAELGRVFASVFRDLQEVVDEIREATFQGRRPAIVEGIWGRMAVECLQELIEGGVEYTEKRTPGSLVLLIIDKSDTPMMTMVRPIVSRVGPGAN